MHHYLSPLSKYHQCNHLLGLVGVRVRQHLTVEMLDIFLVVSNGGLGVSWHNVGAGEFWGSTYCQGDLFLGP